MSGPKQEKDKHDNGGRFAIDGFPEISASVDNASFIRVIGAGGGRESVPVIHRISERNCENTRLTIEAVLDISVSEPVAPVTNRFDEACDSNQGLANSHYL